jgi:hypothetical protein
MKEAVIDSPRFGPTDLTPGVVSATIVGLAEIRTREVALQWASFFWLSSG